MGIKKLARIFLAIAMVVFSVAANATPSCQFGTLNLQPSPPNPIVLTSKTGNPLIFSTNGTATFSCQGGAAGDTLFFTNGGGNQSQVTTIKIPETGIWRYFLLSASRTNSAMPGSGYGYIALDSGVTCNKGYDQFNNPMIILSDNSVCSGRVSLGYTFYTNRANITRLNATSAVLTKNFTSDAAGSNAGWMHLILCSAGGTCSAATPALASANGQDINVIVTTNKPCSTASTQIVTLPTVSSALFTGIGSAAGATFFKITYTCYVPTDTINLINSLTMSVNWLFSTTGNNIDTTPNSFSLLADNTTGNTGVQIQLTTKDGTPITTGMPVYPTDVTLGGEFTYYYIARYVQTGNSVNAGSVGGVATFAATYQ